MKNVFTSLVTVAALASGSAALAEGGFVDASGFINAEHPDVSAYMTELNDNATLSTAQVSERGVTKTVEVTVFANDTTGKPSAFVLR